MYMYKQGRAEQTRGGGYMPSSKYAPDKIKNSMFLPLMKNALMGGKGFSFGIEIILTLLLICVKV